jgi:hypothetical protein
VPPPPLIDEFLDAHAGFATLRDAGAAHAAGAEFTQAANLFREALGAIEAEPDDQSDDLFSYDRALLRPFQVELIDTHLPNLIDSLTGVPRPAPVRGMCPVVDVNLGQFFAGTDLRRLTGPALFPFPDNRADLTQLPDPTFAGALPGATHDEVLCMADLDSPDFVGFDRHGRSEATPFLFEFDIVDPPSNGGPGHPVVPASVQILHSVSPMQFWEDICTTTINGVPTGAASWPAPMVDVTSLFSITQNADGSMSVSGELAAATTGERGCYLDFEVEAEDTSGNSDDDWTYFPLITEGPLARIDPPSGEVGSPFVVSLELTAPFGDADLNRLVVYLDSYGCGTTYVNGEPVVQGLSDITSLLNETPAADRRVLWGTLTVVQACWINIFVDDPWPGFGWIEGAGYRVTP